MTEKDQRIARIRITVRADLIIMLAEFWINRIEQEDTDKETFIEVCELLEAMELKTR